MINRRCRFAFVAHRTGHLALWLVVVGMSGCAGVRGKPFTFDAAYGPDHVNFSGRYAQGLRWLDDGEHYVERRGEQLYVSDVHSGAAAPAYDADAIQAALETVGGLDEAAARRAARDPLGFSNDRNVLLLRSDDRLFVFCIDPQQLLPLSDAATDRREITLSPSGDHVAYVRDNNLFCVDVAHDETRQLTLDGSATVFNGVFDWIYEEEVFGRGHKRGFWWSDDGQSIAFLRLDDTEVPAYPLVDHLASPPKLKEQIYPRAGDPNPVPRLGIVSAAGGATMWVDLSAYDGTDIVIVATLWSPDNRVLFGVQDRTARWLDLCAAGPDGVARRLLRDESPAWLEWTAPPMFLADGSFLWIKASDGYGQVEHHAADGTLVYRLTAGTCRATELLGVDEARGLVYFGGVADPPTETHAFRVPLGGGRVERITSPGASHHVQIDPTCRHFIDTFSDLATPTRVQLCDISGQSIRVLSANDVPALREYDVTMPRLVEMPAARGETLHAVIVRPPDWSPLKRYPVVVYVYGGPAAPLALNRWHGRDFIFLQMFAQHGYIACMIDPDSASGSLKAAWRAHYRLGETELADLETGVRWLGEHEHADLARVALIGHSYGGYFVAYALTHSTMFAAGIAAAPVTDWRFYDSIYTERLMGLPAAHSEAYDRASVLPAAGDLHGRLLLAYGVVDDNVHPYNTLRFMQALYDAGKTFELIVYPGADHGFGRYDRAWHAAQLDFIQRAIPTR